MTALSALNILKSELAQARIWMDFNLLDEANCHANDYSLIRLSKPNYVSGAIITSGSDLDIIRFMLSKHPISIDYVKLVKRINADEIKTYHYSSPTKYNMFDWYSDTTSIYFIPDSKQLANQDLIDKIEFELSSITPKTNLYKAKHVDMNLLGTTEVYKQYTSTTVYNIVDEPTRTVVPSITDSFLTFIGYLAYRKKGFVFDGEAPHGDNIMINLQSLNQFLDRLIAVVDTNIALQV